MCASDYAGENYSLQHTSKFCHTDISFFYSEISFATQKLHLRNETSLLRRNTFCSTKLTLLHKAYFCCTDLSFATNIKGKIVINI